MQKVDEKLVQMTLKQLETSQVMSEETDAALGHCAPYIRNAILSSLYNDQLSKCAPLQVRGVPVRLPLRPSILFWSPVPGTVVPPAAESTCNRPQDTGREFIASIAHSSSMEFFQPDTVILRAKERAANFYFVLSGVLELFDWEDKSLRLLKKGQAFGCESVFCDMAQVRFKLIRYKPGLIG